MTNNGKYNTIFLSKTIINVSKKNCKRKYFKLLVTIKKIILYCVNKKFLFQKYIK